MLLMPAFVMGQNPVSNNKKKEMIERITRVSESLKTLQCDFVQTKQLSMLNDKIVSRGKMYYKQNNALRWQYTSPYTYTFIINGGKVLMQSSSKKHVVDVKSSRMFSEISMIMMNSVTGKCLNSTKDFQVRMFDNGNEWIAEMTPLKKQMKQMFRTIRLHFNVAKSIVNKVEMIEKRGDATIIVMNNVKSNKPVNENLFDIN